MFRSRKAFAALTLVGQIFLVGPARAQTGPISQAGGDPSTARIHLGPVAIAPTIALTNLGVDSNVFNTGGPLDPTSDVTATVGPALDAWVRLSRVKFSGRAVLNYMYFKELSDLRSFQLTSGGRVEVPLNRVTPFADGSYVNSNAREGFEIDAYAAHKENTGRIGVDFRLTSKTGVEIYAGQIILDYRADALERQGFLQQARLALRLNRPGLPRRGSPICGDAADHVGLFGEQQQDRFQFAANKNADSYRIEPFVEFKPFALIGGRASLGYRNVTFIQSGAPDFQGPVGRIDLSYTLLGRTVFSVNARRDLEFSLYNEQNYLIGTIGGGITHRLNAGWDVRGSVAAYRLTYRNRFPGGLGDLPQERGISGRGEVGYQLRRSRVSFYVDGSQRNSEVSSVRGYDRWRFGSTIFYTF